LFGPALIKEKIMRTIAAITAILAGAFALGTVLPAAGEDKPAVAQTEKSTPKRAFRPHSHAEEKTGVPQPQLAAAPDTNRPNPWTDYSRHFHSRDR
jgi:hypothetical protein